jgi:hypothetical protein
LASIVGTSAPAQLASIVGTSAPVA